MMDRVQGRSSHPCLDRDCGHPESEHLHTPELAGTLETVVWCAACRRHEIRRPSRWWGLAIHRSGRRKALDFGRPS
jgi:hypothetical protein